MLSTEIRTKPSDQQLDLVLHAISDVTRRELLGTLKRGPAMITELAAPFKMSLPAVSKHLRVLERAHLVERTVNGRVHRFTLAPGPLASVEQWLGHYRTFWEDSLELLAQYAESYQGARSAKRARNDSKANRR